MAKLLFKRIRKDIIQCNACSWYCKLADKQFGRCGIRLNNKGKLSTLVYNEVDNIAKIIGPEIDPVEKKPLFHFLPATKIFSFGTFGCNFGCAFCQNSWHTMPTKEVCLETIPDTEKFYKIKNIIDEVSELYSPTELIDMAFKLDCKSIGYTYNEPVIFSELAYECAKLAKKKGLKNVYVSNGFESKESIDLIADYLDAINIDLKAFNERFYREIVKGKLDVVKKNIKRFYELGIWTEITTLVIPGRNDSTCELKDAAEFIYKISPDIPWHVTAFHPAYKMQNVSHTPESSLKKVYDIGKRVGLNYIYIGNIWGEDLHSTYCPKCKKKIIRRDWTYTEIEALRNGKCVYCGAEIKGVWK